MQETVISFPRYAIGLLWSIALSWIQVNISFLLTILLRAMRSTSFFLSLKQPVSFLWNSFLLKQKTLFWTKVSLLEFFVLPAPIPFERLSGAGLEPVLLLLLNSWASCLSTWLPLLCWRPMQLQLSVSAYFSKPSEAKAGWIPKQVNFNF